MRRSFCRADGADPNVAATARMTFALKEGISAMQAKTTAAHTSPATVDCVPVRVTSLRLKFPTWRSVALHSRARTDVLFEIASSCVRSLTERRSICRLVPAMSREFRVSVA